LQVGAVFVADAEVVHVSALVVDGVVVAGG